MSKLSRRLLLILGLFGACLFAPTVQGDDQKTMRIYIGTGGEKSKGIYTSVLDLATGRLSPAKLAASAKRPGFLAVHPTDPTLIYAVGEVTDSSGKPTGGVSSFERDLATGQLTFLNAESSGGAGPCHVNVDATGKHVLVANYGGGSIASLPILEGGRLGPATSVIQHTGSSVNPQRQKEPHAHSINLDKANRFVFAADLGLDQVLVYRFDSSSGKLSPNEPPFAKVTPGAGPRHFAFHPGGKFAYVINEIGNTVTTFQFDAAKGVLTPIQEIGTLPEGFQGISHTAEVVVHPTGKFLYGSNRGSDTIAVFAIDAGTGQLKAVSHHPTGGKTPRNFVVDPTGRWLLAENQASDTIVVFGIELESGRLKETGQSIDVPTPTCIRFVR